MGGKPLSGTTCMYPNSTACVRAEASKCDFFLCVNNMDMKQGRVKSPYLFNVHMDGVMKE